jgi:O-antigen/teichoic acid export membrane protein
MCGIVTKPAWRFAPALMETSPTVPERRTQFATRLQAHARTPLLRNAYALILSAGLTSVLGLLYWMLAARRFPPEVVGLNSALISAMLLVAGVAQLGLVSVMTRYLPQAGPSSRRLVLAGYGFTLAAAAIGGLVFASGAARWAPVLAFLGEEPGFTLWFVAAVMAWCIFTVQDSVLAGMRQTLWVPVENTAFALGKIVLLLAASSAVYGIFASWTICVLAVLLPVNLLIFRRLPAAGAPQTGDDLPPAGQIARFAAANYCGALLSLVTTALLPLLVAQRLGPSATAFFAQPWLIASSLQLAAGNMAVSLTVEAAADREQLPSYLRRALIHTGRLLLPAVALVALGAPLILGIFGADYAAEGAWLLRLLALGALPNMVVMFALSAARVRERPGTVLRIQAALAALTLAFSLALMERFGITGVGAAWLAAQSIVAAGVVIRWKLERRT